MLQLDEGEKVLVIIRKHWLPLAIQACVLALGVVVPFLVLQFLPQEIFAPLNALPHANYIVIFSYSAWMLLLWVSFFVLWTKYYLDVWVVTNRRIIDIDQESLFHRKLVSARLEKVQDAHVEVEGVIATFFGYGTLTLYTAGENPDIVIDNAAHPYEAKEKLMAAQRAQIEPSKGDSGMIR
jgi:hypothetical protein